MSVQELNRQGLQNISDAVMSLAGLEGLDAHVAAVSRRLAGQS
jgi:histidinol dehydrogenase